MLERADDAKALWMGLQDHYDVKLPCHLLLAKLAAAAPGQLLANLHRLTDPLEKTLQTKVKADAVKQEVCLRFMPLAEEGRHSHLKYCPSRAPHPVQTRCSAPSAIFTAAEVA